MLEQEDYLTDAVQAVYIWAFLAKDRFRPHRIKWAYPLGISILISKAELGRHVIAVLGLQAGWRTLRTQTNS